RAESVRETLSNCAVDTLFGEASGMLVLSSSTPGEFSWSTERGGLFTQALYNTLATGCKNGTFRWEQILKNIQQKTAKYQRPQLAWFAPHHA
ncbi:MAG: caspase family protein, partial [Chlamydiia bacterium]|nr:caspase family protein [Chlamydiia bacterium]